MNYISFTVRDSVMYLNVWIIISRPLVKLHVIINHHVVSVSFLGADADGPITFVYDYCMTIFKNHYVWDFYGLLCFVFQIYVIMVHMFRNNIIFWCINGFKKFWMQSSWGFRTQTLSLHAPPCGRGCFICRGHSHTLL